MAEQIVIGTKLDLTGLQKGERALIRSAKKIEDSVTKEIAGLGEVVTKGSDSIVLLGKEFSRASIAGAALSASITVATGGIVALGVAVAGATTYVSKMTLEQAELVFEMQRLSANTGVSVENVNSLARSFQSVGESVSTSRDFVNDFAERLGDARTGNKTYAESFKAIGVSLDLDVNTALEKTFENLSLMEDKQQSLFRGIEIFSNEYKLIADLVADRSILGDGLLSGQAIENTTRLNEATRSFKANLSDTKNQALEPFVEVLADFSETMSDSEINTQLFVDKMEALSEVTELVLSGIHGIAIELDLLTISETSVTEALQQRIKQYSELSTEELKEIQGNLKEILAPADEVNRILAQMSETIQEGPGAGAGLIAAADALSKDFDQDKIKNSRALLAGLERELEIRSRIASQQSTEAATEVIIKYNKEIERSQKATKELNDSTWQRIEVIDTLGEKLSSIDEKREAEKQQDLDEIARMEELKDARISIAQEAAQGIISISESLVNNSLNNDRRELSAWRQKELAKLGTLNVTARRRKQLEDKIAKETEQREAEIARKRGAMQIAMGWSDAASGIMGAWSQALRSSPPPLAVPQAITTSALMTGIATANTAIIASQMQGFADGGVVGGGNPVSTIGGDDTMIKARTGERVLNAEQQSRLDAVLFGGAGGGVGGTIININGNVTQDQLSELEDLLRELQSNNRLSTQVVS